MLRTWPDNSHASAYGTDSSPRGVRAACHKDGALATHCGGGGATVWAAYVTRCPTTNGAARLLCALWECPGQTRLLGGRAAARHTTELRRSYRSEPHRALDRTRRWSHRSRNRDGAYRGLYHCQSRIASASYRNSSNCTHGHCTLQFRGPGTFERPRLRRGTR